MRQRKDDAVAIAARRAKVAELILERMPYRVIAAQFGVSHVTIVGDVAAIRKEWAKTYGRTDEMFDCAVMDMDALQSKAMDVLEASTGPDRLAAIDRVVKIADQRNKLLNLYPKPGSHDEPTIPTGPIEVTIQMLPSGNRRLLTKENDAINAADWTTVEQEYNHDTQ